MAAPAPSQLDHQQCIQGSFDEDTGRLRVDATLSATIIPPPGLEVSISASDDNIAIRNSNNNNELLINSDGSINVNTIFPSSIDVDVISSVLPTGAATASNQTDGSQKAQTVDGSGNVWGPRTGSGGVNWMPIINLEGASNGSAVAPRTLQVGGSDGANIRTLSTDTNGRLNVSSIQLFTKPFDSITATYPSATQEVYASRIGGVGGAVQQTATVNYTDSSKNFLLDVAVV